MGIHERAIIDLEKLKPHGIEMWLHHIRRYQFATTFLKETDTVLDICCGTGYGSSIMSEVAEKVTGIDRLEAIDYAKSHYPSCRFLVRNVVQYEFPVTYDVVTMFECLDHLEKEDGLNLLSRAAGSCRGFMFLSLPQDQKFDTNPYHLAEWTSEKLKATLGKYFDRVILFGQSWASGVISYPYDERRSITVFLASKIVGTG